MSGAIGLPRQRLRVGAVYRRASLLRTFRQLVPPSHTSRDLVVKVAESDEERSAAFRLLHGKRTPHTPYTFLSEREAPKPPEVRSAQVVA